MKRAVLVVVVLSSAVSTAWAKYEKSDPGEPLPETLHRPDGEVETKLMSELACVCGGCELEPIVSCKCPFAAKMREQVKQRLATDDYTAVRSSFVDEYGTDVIGKSPQPASFAASLLPIGAVLAFLAAAIALLTVLARRRRPPADS